MDKFCLILCVITVFKKMAESTGKKNIFKLSFIFVVCNAIKNKLCL
jgi:hypothetical protein